MFSTYHLLKNGRKVLLILFVLKENDTADQVVISFTLVLIVLKVLERLVYPQMSDHLEP